MADKFIVLFWGVIIVAILIGPPCALGAYELPLKPDEPSPTLDLRTAEDAYNPAWIEKARTVYADRQSGTLDAVYICLSAAVILVLALFILLGARLNGLDRHLRLFTADQFKAALQLWMIRRWGLRA